MSRRFGRNQKRRMRAEIAARDHQIRRQEHQIGFLRERAAAIDYIREVLPEFTALLPPEDFYVTPSAFGNQFVRITSCDRVLDLSPRGDLSGGSLCRFFDLPTVQAWLESEPMRGVLHANVSRGVDRWAYAVSYSAARRMPTARLAAMIADSLSTLIAAELQKGVRR